MKAPRLPQFHLGTTLTLLAGAGVFCALTAVFFFINRSQVHEKKESAPTGYRDNVIKMVKNGDIRHERAMDPDKEPYWGKLQFVHEKASSRLLKFYAESKRLQRDIKEFNDTGDGFFTVLSDNSIAIVPQYHDFALPYPKRTTWRGTFSLAGEKLPSLANENLHLGFSATDETGTATAQEYKLLPQSDWLLGNKKQPHHRSRAYELLGPDGPMLRLSLYGEHVAMQLLPEAPCQITLNGQPLTRANPAAVDAFLARAADLGGVTLPPNSAPLRDGDRLRILSSQNGEEVALRFGKFAAGMVSRRWLEDGKEVNLVDPELTAELPYFQQLQDALNRFIQAHPHPEQIGQPNVQLSIDRALHGGVSRIFLHAVREFDRNRSAIRGISQEPASVCIINALNGDVLAMPSYPAESDLEELRKRARTQNQSGITEARLRRLSVNQNLPLIPIGSTTKPLFASAVWDVHPDFSKLVIVEPTGGRSEVLGYRLAAPYGTDGRHGRVDANGFLRMSSNDYTMHLGLLILAQGVTVNNAGSPVYPTGRVNLADFFRNDTIPGGLSESSTQVFPKMRECYDVGLVVEAAHDPATEWETDFIAPMLQQLGLPKEVTAKGPVRNDAELKQLREIFYNSFSTVLPKKANLDLPSVSTVRGRYASMLLGSGSNRWSNFKLAEAYARLGTGKKVVARLTVDPQKPVTLDSFPDLPLERPTLAKVHAGMQQCAEGGDLSTAARISSSIRQAREHFAAKGLALFAIAKTGTAMRQPAVVVGGVVKQEKRECASLCLYLELRDSSGTPLAALSCATYLQDRAATRGNESPMNSAVAVQMTKDFFPELISWMESQSAVKKALSER